MNRDAKRPMFKSGGPNWEKSGLSPSMIKLPKTRSNSPPKAAPFHHQGPGSRRRTAIQRGPPIISMKTPAKRRNMVPPRVISPTILRFSVSSPEIELPPATVLIRIAMREPIPPAMSPAIMPESVPMTISRPRTERGQEGDPTRVPRDSLGFVL